MKVQSYTFRIERGTMCVCIHVCTYISPFPFLKYVCVLQFQAHEGKKVSIVLCSAEPGTMQIKARCNEKLLKNRLKKTIMKGVEALTALATKTQHSLNWRLSLKVRSYGEEGRLAGLDSRALQLSSACITCSCQGTSALAKGLLEGRRGCTVGYWRSLLVALWGWLEEGKDGLSGCAWAWGPSLLLTHLLFPQLDVSFQRQKREGWTFASWVIFFSNCGFMGCFTKCPFLPHFVDIPCLWDSLSMLTNQDV